MGCTGPNRFVLGRLLCSQVEAQGPMRREYGATAQSRRGNREGREASRPWLPGKTEAQERGPDEAAGWRLIYLCQRNGNKGCRSQVAYRGHVRVVVNVAEHLGATTVVDWCAGHVELQRGVSSCDAERMHHVPSLHAPASWNQRRGVDPGPCNDLDGTGRCQIPRGPQAGSPDLEVSAGATEELT